MQVSTAWFLCLSALTILGLSLGCWLGKTSVFRARAGLALGVVLLVTWAWLFHHPSVAVRIFPAGVLQYLEGTAGVPIFMIVVGIVLTSGARRQKRLSIAAVVFGLLFFLQGGFWMIQTTPQAGFADQRVSRSIVMQSQEFSCVPAACATALNTLGYPTTEAQMAQLTGTRPGTGATMIRAMSGLQQQLTGMAHDVELVEISLEQVRSISTPALTPVRTHGSRFLHMVAILETRADDVLIADPQSGLLCIEYRELADTFTGAALIFREK